MHEVKQVEIDGYRLEIRSDGASIWFLDEEDAPLNGLISEVTQENRDPHKNWEDILNQVDKPGQGFAYWILEKDDEERKTLNFRHFLEKWEKSNIAVTVNNTSIWCARTSWDPESAYIPHGSLIKILKIAREMRFGEEKR